MSALHITNGDCAADTLRAFLTDPVVITADPLFDGPASEVDDDAWYAMRARTLAEDDEGARRIAAELASLDRALANAAARGDEVVLWFEHDLFDQLLLVRTLSRLASGATASLICIDRFPCVEQFIGLGQLTAAQLATLLPARKPVEAPHVDQATRVWKAFRATDPTSLSTMTSAGPLPFLGTAVRRFLEEYPSTANGLSRSATQVLGVLADGPRDGGVLFAASQEREESPFMGDWSLFDVTRALARGRVPLVTINPEPRVVDLRGHTVAITDAGRDVLAGRKDGVTLNGIDVWRGGVHLSGWKTPWRWDAARQTLISWGDHTET